MTKAPTTAVLRVACVLTLLALALMSWSLFDPRPFPVIAAMSIGQVLGTLSFLAYLYVVAKDLRPFEPRTGPEGRGHVTGDVSETDGLGTGGDEK